MGEMYIPVLQNFLTLKDSPLAPIYLKYVTRIMMVGERCEFYYKQSSILNHRNGLRVAFKLTKTHRLPGAFPQVGPRQALIDWDPWTSTTALNRGLRQCGLYSHFWGWGFNPPNE